MDTAEEHLTKKQLGMCSRFHLYWKYKTECLRQLEIRNRFPKYSLHPKGGIVH